MFIRGMMGLGMESLACLRQNYPGAYLVTPWPELYSDLDVKRVRPIRSSGRRPKTSVGTVNGTSQRRVERPAPSPTTVSQSSKACGNASVPIRRSSTFLISASLHRLRVVTSQRDPRQYALNGALDTRNPLPEYIASASAEMRRRGWKVVSVADLEEGKEWPVGELPPADMRFHKGELRVTQLLSLLQHADAVIGGYWNGSSQAVSPPRFWPGSSAAGQAVSTLRK